MQILPRFSFLLGILLSLPLAAPAEPEAGRMVKVTPGKNDLIPYWIYLPKDYASKADSTRWPVVIFLFFLGT